ncbi:hypothetical protein EMIT0215P_250036 [Pseudomonas serboccidentalis]
MAFPYGTQKIASHHYLAALI